MLPAFSQHVYTASREKLIISLIYIINLIYLFSGVQGILFRNDACGI